MRRVMRAQRLSAPADVTPPSGSLDAKALCNTTSAQKQLCAAITLQIFGYLASVSSTAPAIGLRSERWYPGQPYRLLGGPAVLTTAPPGRGETYGEGDGHLYPLPPSWGGPAGRLERPLKINDIGPG